MLRDWIRQTARPALRLSQQMSAGFDTLAGVWGGTVADAALEELLRMAPPPVEWGDVPSLVQRYLQRADRGLLCDAADALLASIRSYALELDCAA